MEEITINLHMHTHYSDGHTDHRGIAAAALKSGLDAVIVTDHNIWVQGPQGYYRENTDRVLLLVGEEIHDQARQPQKNHLLVFGVEQELAHLASEPQILVDRVRQSGGLAFIAHPVDPAAPAVNEPDISWEAWDVNGYTGIELWNAFSEYKARIHSLAHAIYYAYSFPKIARGPQPQALKKWDELTCSGKKVVAVGGSDAHAIPARLGPLRRTIFPYTDHFRAVNSHLILPSQLTGEVDRDRKSILAALADGHIFIGYDLPASTNGFRFYAQGQNNTACMGDEIQIGSGLTLQIRLPETTECILLKNGEPFKRWHTRPTCTALINEPGVYRVEVYRQYLGRRRGWIFSNPIYVRP